MIKIEGLLNPDELARVIALAADDEFASGAKTAGYRAVRVKNNLEMDAESEKANEIGIIVLTAVERHGDFNREIIPAKATAPVVSRYLTGMHFGEHLDEPFSKAEPRIRRDVSMTLFLSDPASYDGGELVIQSEFGASPVKMPKNGAVFYNADRLHRVAEVTRGERLAVVGWFQSHVRDPSERKLVADALTVAQRMFQLEPDGPLTNRAFQIWSNLLRRWAEN